MEDGKRQEEFLMRIAVAYDADGTVFQHFGKTEQFKVYTVEDKEIKKTEILSSDGLGHGALAGLLAEKQVDVLICGGMGPGAQMALAQADIQVCAGVSGDADEAVRKYLAGTLAYSAEAACGHHEEHPDDGCEYSCH